MIAIIMRFFLFLILLAIVLTVLFLFFKRWIIPLFNSAKKIEEEKFEDFEDFVEEKTEDIIGENTDEDHKTTGRKDSKTRKKI